MICNTALHDHWSVSVTISYYSEHYFQLTLYEQ